METRPHTGACDHPGEVAFPRLDKGTKLVAESRPRPASAGWSVTAYPDAGEAVFFFRGAWQPTPSGQSTGGDPAANRLRAERRAQTKVRRYCAANGIDRLATLTFAPPFCTDAKELRGHVSRFIRRMRCARGGKFPYVWVPELHKDGERLHVHVGLAEYIAKAELAALWGHGFVDVRLVRSGSRGSDSDRARRAARYLSKYVGKAFDAVSVIGCHRYEVAQGFQPRQETMVFGSELEARQWASTLMGGETPSHVWYSSEVEDWQGPPTEVAFWDR